MNRRLETTLVVGAPLALAVLELFHPQPHDLWRRDLRAWMAVHPGGPIAFGAQAVAAAWLRWGADQASSRVRPCPRGRA